MTVSISSTSEEVQRVNTTLDVILSSEKFPLVQLPKKFRASSKMASARLLLEFPLVQLPKKFRAESRPTRLGVESVSISSTSEEVQRRKLVVSNVGQETRFPLVQLPKKFRAVTPPGNPPTGKFPLVQLPKKFRVVMVKTRNARL